MVPKPIFLLRCHLFQNCIFSSLHKSETPCIISPQLPFHFELYATLKSLLLSRIHSSLLISSRSPSSSISQSVFSPSLWDMTLAPSRRGALGALLSSSSPRLCTLHAQPCLPCGDTQDLLLADPSLGLGAAGGIEAEGWLKRTPILQPVALTCLFGGKVLRLASLTDCLGRGDDVR